MAHIYEPGDEPYRGGNGGLTSGGGLVQTPHPAASFKYKTPGFTPDYASLLKINPAYLAWVSGRTGALESAGAQRKAAIRALLVNFGGLPKGLTDQYGDVDPETLKLAGNNQFSTLSQIKKAYDDSVFNDKRALAARGALQSGDLGYALNKDDYARGQSENTATQQALGALSGDINQYLHAGDQYDQQLPGLIDQIMASLRQTNPVIPEGQAEATLVPDWQTRYGHPVYTGADGQLWTLDGSGNPVKFSPAPTGPPPVDPYQYGDIYG